MKNLSRYVAIGITLLVVGFLVYTFRQIVTYVLIAWVLSMIGQPLMRFFQSRIRFGKFKAGPNISAVLTLLTFFFILAILISMFVPLIIDQANNLAGVDYAAIGSALEQPINQFYQWLESYGIQPPESNPEELLSQTLRDNFDPGKFGNIFGSILSAAGGILITTFSVVFITFFFLKEQGLFVNFLAALVPIKFETKVKNSVADASSLLTRYFGGILIQISIITIYVSLLLHLLGVSNALLIGFFAALINVIPYVGPIIGAGFGVFITISSNLDLEFYNEMLPLLLKVLAVFASMQLLDNFVLQPFIFSSSVLAHPLEIFIVILMGAQINGITGMVLAIPAYTVIRVIAKAFLSEFKIVKTITRNMKRM